MYLVRGGVSGPGGYLLWGVYLIWGVSARGVCSLGGVPGPSGCVCSGGVPGLEGVCSGGDLLPRGMYLVPGGCLLGGVPGPGGVPRHRGVYLVRYSPLWTDRRL